MTSQIPDKVSFNGKLYDIVGIYGSGLFSVEEYGIKTEPLHTACWRGYYLRYVVEDGLLKLNELTLRDLEEAYKPIAGILPSLETFRNQDGEEEVISGTYTDMQVNLEFSGGLLLGCDFIQDLYVHMGFQKPYRFRTVIELLFEKGNLLKQIDHSRSMAEIRERMTNQGDGVLESFDPDKMIGWIEWSFSLDYNF